MDSVLIVKVISALLYPLGLVSMLVVSALVCSAKRKPLLAKFCTVIALTVLFVSSSPVISSRLVSGLEKQYPQLEIDSIPEHDAIIVLGGGLRIPTAPAKHAQLARGSDRYWYAARLFDAGKAGKIIISGGNVFEQPGLNSEAFYAAQLLQKWGVPADAIELEGRSRTTLQNQANIVDLVRQQEIKSALLVTSAIHMPRAHYLFRRLPISITPASADVLIREQNSPQVFNYLPSVSALALTTSALHEYYGLWYEWLKPGVL